MKGKSIIELDCLCKEPGHRAFEHPMAELLQPVKLKRAAGYLLLGHMSSFQQNDFGRQDFATDFELHEVDP
jgi:hypothetical protein